MEKEHFDPVPETIERWLFLVDVLTLLTVINTLLWIGFGFTRLPQLFQASVAVSVWEGLTACFFILKCHTLK